MGRRLVARTVLLVALSKGVERPVVARFLQAFVDTSLAAAVTLAYEVVVASIVGEAGIQLSRALLFDAVGFIGTILWAVVRIFPGSTLTIATCISRPRPRSLFQAARLLDAGC